MSNRENNIGGMPPGAIPNIMEDSQTQRSPNDGLMKEIQKAFMGRRVKKLGDNLDKAVKCHVMVWRDLEGYPIEGEMHGKALGQFVGSFFLQVSWPI